MTGRPAALARRFSSASRAAIGRACTSKRSPPGNSMSLITSISTSAAGALSGALPWRSGFFAGIHIDCTALRDGGGGEAVGFEAAGDAEEARLAEGAGHELDAEPQIARPRDGNGERREPTKEKGR